MILNASHSILVTGGAGFIGSNLCDRLIQSGHRVICMDNLRTGERANIRALIKHPRFTFVEHDVCDPIRIRGPLDRIYNLACPASPRHYQKDPLATMKTCVLGAYNVLDLARRKNARVLQASTSEVYGDPDVHPQPEDYAGCVNPVGPRACYDEGKRAAETIFMDHYRAHGTVVKIARIFNTYGPRMLENDGRVVSNFIVQALRSEPLTIYGDGSQTRSFCYIEDLLNGLELLMEAPPEVIGPCNLGNPHEISVADIARAILKHTRSRSKVVHRPLPQDDPKRRRPVIDQAMALLGWQPRVSLQQGLRLTTDYFCLKLFTPAAATREAQQGRSGERLHMSNGAQTAA
jgi:UDP-glucuronate decarboxylase